MLPLFLQSLETDTRNFMKSICARTQRAGSMKMISIAIPATKSFPSRKGPHRRPKYKDPHRRPPKKEPRRHRSKKEGPRRRSALQNASPQQQEENIRPRRSYSRQFFYFDIV